MCVFLEIAWTRGQKCINGRGKKQNALARTKRFNLANGARAFVADITYISAARTKPAGHLFRRLASLSGKKTQRIFYSSSVSHIFAKMPPHRPPCATHPRSAADLDRNYATCIVRCAGSKKKTSRLLDVLQKNASLTHPQ